MRLRYLGSPKCRCICRETGARVRTDVMVLDQELGKSNHLESGLGNGRLGLAGAPKAPQSSSPIAHLSAPRAEHWGDLITANHKVLNEGGESRNNSRYAVLVQDLATQWIQSYPCKTNTSQETQRSLQKILGPDGKLKVICTDNSLEFGKACEDLSWNHCMSTPHRSETNGIAERAVRRVKEGTSAVLLQSGLDEKWWADSLWNVTAIRETFKASWQMGKLHTKDVLENLSKDQSFRLVRWVSITLFLRKTSHESVNVERKSYLDCSLDTLCTLGEFGRVTCCLQTLRS